jgi:hypothetical protein
MVSDARQLLDDRGDPRQGPQIGTKALRRRAGPECPFHGSQSFGMQPRLAAGPPRALQPRAAPDLPRMVPMVRADSRHAKLLGYRRLRCASREQPRGLQPARFQRGKIPSGSGHASACDDTREIR